MLLQLSGHGPLYRQFYESCKQAILFDILKAGEKLPSSRELSLQYKCSRNTIVNAYDQLVCEGYLESRHGEGTFVSDLTPSQINQKTQ